MGDDNFDFELTERAWQEMLMGRKIENAHQFLNITNNLEGRRLSLKLFDQWKFFHPDKAYPDNCFEQDVRRYLGYRWQLKEKRSEKIMSQFKKIEAVILSNKPIYKEKQKMAEAVPAKATPAKAPIKPFPTKAKTPTKPANGKKKFPGIHAAAIEYVLQKKYTDAQINSMLSQKFPGWNYKMSHGIIAASRWRIKKGLVKGVAAGTVINEILPKK